jgi:2-polyprenyl-3-methyl-5-hydroxy-6-metoxy-1,4-benzoquinol methylase
MTERGRGEGRSSRTEPRSEAVATAFDAASDYWETIYDETTVEAVVYQARRAVVEGWIAELPLEPGARVLEVGPGAGRTTVALARRGLEVDAIDVSETMLERVQQRAEAEAVQRLVHTRRGTAESVGAADGAYSLVIAVGVLPWVDEPQRTVRELARVAEPNGWIVLTSDNRARLTFFLDPFVNPWLQRPRSLLRKGRDLIRRRPPRSREVLWRMYSRGFVDRLLTSDGLAKVRAVTVGFGPFTLAGRHAVPRQLEIRLHRGLQRLADHGVPLVRATGSHYVVLAQKELR